MKRLAVIMAGGSGERFWPLSSSDRPKQLLRLTNPRQTLLEEAVSRIVTLVGSENVLIATGRLLAEPILRAGLVRSENVLAEPDRRNTLGCLCWVTANLLARGDADVTLAVLTADHAIGDPDRFRKDIALALDAAEATGGLVTVGVPPSRPEIGYGYIEVDRAGPVEPGAFAAKSFREKPSSDLAAKFLESGDFLWNSGMFFWTLSSFQRELAAAEPEAAKLARSMADAIRAGRSEEAEKLFSDLPNLSIDYALMERATTVYVVEARFPWDDVGAWDALERTLPGDPRGNVASGDVVLVDCEGTIVYNDSPLSVAGVLGARDMIVVLTQDALLVCPKSEAQRVRELVEQLRQRGGKL